MAKKGWDEFEIGAMLRTFDGKIDDIAGTRQEDRAYSQNSSYTASVADWRLIKPVFNKDYCIDCQFCWIYCPDVSIVSRDKKLIGVDMDHCKGCGICVEVCPTNPKSLQCSQNKQMKRQRLLIGLKKMRRKRNGI